MKIRFKKRTSEKVKSRLVKRARVRKKVVGTADRPRVSVFKSNAGLFVQVIDDVKGLSLLGLSTKHLGLPLSVDSANKLGEELGRRIIQRGLNQVTFDRGGYPYHGRVKAVAEGLRQAGIKI